MLQPYQQRVVDEKKALDEKATALSNFIGHSDTFLTLDPAEQERLREQNDIMWRYSEILGQRIAAFPPPPPEEPRVLTFAHPQASGGPFKFPHPHWVKRQQGSVFRQCSYCGSMEPAALAHALREPGGIRLELADMKYGWPHKAYVYGMESWMKFYTIHLKEATPEDADTICKALGLQITFEGDDKVTWKPYS